MRDTMRWALMTAVMLLIGCLIFPGAAEEVMPPNMRIVNCKEYVSLREKPSKSAKRLAKVPLGAEVTAWLDGGNEGEDSFVYCEYGGKEGYILEEYLAPILQTYDTGLGFSFEYNPYRLEPDQTMSESGNSVLVEWIGSEDSPAYMELMLPEVIPGNPQEFVAANTDYMLDPFTTNAGASVTGGSGMNEDYTLVNGWYLVSQGEHTLLVSITCAAEAEEMTDSDFQNILRSIKFTD